ncbi:HAD family phosphatase [Segetibacter sp. 3557_3]|uniref:HAD family hydrolase n=1 Tax=Segetibacter sp. 3557_3 TaxID=2547429 RepID=UPI0010585EAF|nr:HAD family phosphatase [Segetibacter sp. 3557_3]TDH21492.1 HAD family phosphatase [Segetibacter sp. 3557_3]
METKAFLFDLNGTMIDDMYYHIRAWYDILNQLGAKLSMDEVKAQCYGKNHELLERIFPGRFSVAEKDKMSYEKEKAYQQAFRPQLKLLDGLSELLEIAYNSGIKMAIGSAAIMYNIDFVLDGTNIRKYFDAIVSADDVRESKPNPETFLEAALRLGVSPESCIVFEDTPKGVEAAFNAGMRAAVITTIHEPAEFNHLNNVIGFASDFISLKHLLPKQSLKEVLS